MTEDNINPAKRFFSINIDQTEYAQWQQGLYNATRAWYRNFRKNHKHLPLWSKVSDRQKKYIMTAYRIITTEGLNTESLVNDYLTSIFTIEGIFLERDEHDIENRIV